MIYIKERLTEKVPGETSLFISFSYNEEITRIIKSFGVYGYSKKTKEFELPILFLSKFLDSVCNIDSVEIELLDNIDRRISIELKCQYKIPPFDYQLDGIRYGLSHESFLLLDMPGLGKTSQIIHIAEERFARKEIEHCLIICGVNTLKSNWAREIEKHSDLDCMVLGEKTSKRGTKSIGSVKDRVDQLSNVIDKFFIVTNIETIRSSDVVEKILNGPNKIGMVVVDEIHCAKSPNSQQGSNLLKLSKIKYKIGATGTLIMNNPIDSYLPLKWIGCEKSSLTKFRDYYCVLGGRFNNIVFGYKNLDSLKQQIENNSIRRLKDKINLPPKIVINEYVDMGDKQSNFYRDIEHGIANEVDKVELTQTSLLAMVSRLRQATACPAILTTQDIGSAKIERAVDLVEQIISGGNKVVVFSTFKETVNELHKKLIELDISDIVCTGDTKDSEIERNKDIFQNDKWCSVMLCTWQKMGTGQTLTAASYAIFIDTPWTYAVYCQAQDRVHRIGTKDNVTIYNLITKGTIDERVLEILNDKEAIGDFIVDDKVTDKTIESLRRYVHEIG